MTASGDTVIVSLYLILFRDCHHVQLTIQSYAVLNQLFSVFLCLSQKGSISEVIVEEEILPGPRAYAATRLHELENKYCSLVNGQNCRYIGHYLGPIGQVLEYKYELGNKKRGVGALMARDVVHR